jgi:hypothetical protein
VVSIPASYSRGSRFHYRSLAWASSWFSSVPKGNAGIVPEDGSQPLPSTPFPIHHSLSLSNSGRQNWCRWKGVVKVENNPTSSKHIRMWVVIFKLRPLYPRGKSDGSSWTQCREFSPLPFSLRRVNRSLTFIACTVLMYQKTRIKIITILIHLCLVLSHQDIFKILFQHAPYHKNSLPKEHVTSHFLRKCRHYLHPNSSTWHLITLQTFRTPQHCTEIQFIERKSPRALWSSLTSK